MTLQQVFIANLKKIRKERGLSQMALSEKCDTTSNYIGQIEMGRRNPSFEKIEQIAEALKIAPCRLFEVTAKENSETIETGDYLQKMPSRVKKELVSRLLAMIKTDIIKSFDSENY